MSKHEVPSWLRGAADAWEERATNEEAGRLALAAAQRQKDEEAAAPFEKPMAQLIAKWEGLRVDEIVCGVQALLHLQPKGKGHKEREVSRTYFVFKQEGSTSFLEVTESDGGWRSGYSRSYEHPAEPVPLGQLLTNAFENHINNVSVSHMGKSIYSYGFSGFGNDELNSTTHFSIELYPDRVTVDGQVLGTAQEIQSPEELKKRINQYFEKKNKSVF